MWIHFKDFAWESTVALQSSALRFILSRKWWIDRPTIIPRAMQLTLLNNNGMVVIVWLISCYGGSICIYCITCCQFVWQLTIIGRKFFKTELTCFPTKWRHKHKAQLWRQHMIVLLQNLFLFLCNSQPRVNYDSRTSRNVRLALTVCFQGPVRMRLSHPSWLC